MVTKLNPSVITDDMMYEGGIQPLDNAPQYTLRDEMRENQLWHEIRRAAKTNSTLQSALEECIIIYKLSKEYKNGI